MTETTLQASAPGAAGRLSGQVVGQLEPGEQLVLWALRQRHRDGAGADASPALVHGFRLAFGLARLEPALAALAGLHDALLGHGRAGEAGFLPLRCACVSAGERAAVGLVAAAQAGEGPWLAALAHRLVAPAGAAALRAGAVALAAELGRAGLALPPLAAPVAATLH